MPLIIPLHTRIFCDGVSSANTVVGVINDSASTSPVLGFAYLSHYDRAVRNL